MQCKFEFLEFLIFPNIPYSGEVLFLKNLLSRHHHTDGAYFGTGFPHMLFMVHPEYRPKRPANQVHDYHRISSMFGLYSNFILSLFPVCTDSRSTTTRINSSSKQLPTSRYRVEDNLGLRGPTLTGALSLTTKSRSKTNKFKMLLLNAKNACNTGILSQQIYDCTPHFPCFLTRNLNSDRRPTRQNLAVAKMFVERDDQINRHFKKNSD